MAEHPTSDEIKNAVANLEIRVREFDPYPTAILIYSALGWSAVVGRFRTEQHAEPMAALAELDANITRHSNRADALARTLGIEVAA